jgi:predicted nucleotidyltransferase
MAQTDVLNIALKYANAVNKQYDTCKIYLFGSQVKGDFHKDSDIDIAVVFKDYANRMDIQLELMRLRRNIDSRIEPHPFRESEFVISNLLADEILKYGIEIYN